MQLAQALKIPGLTGTIEGPLNKPGQPQFTTLSDLLTRALPLLFPIAGLILFAYLVWGGFDYLTSMGDPKKADAGRSKITSAIIGFIIIFASYWIVQIVDYLFKIGIYS